MRGWLTEGAERHTGQWLLMNGGRGAAQRRQACGSVRRAAPPTAFIACPGHGQLSQPPNLTQYVMPLVLECQVFSHNWKLNARQNTNTGRGGACRRAGHAAPGAPQAGVSSVYGHRSCSSRPCDRLSRNGARQLPAEAGDGPEHWELCPPSQRRLSHRQVLAGVGGACRGVRAGGRGALSGLCGHRLSLAERVLCCSIGRPRPARQAHSEVMTVGLRFSY